MIEQFAATLSAHDIHAFARLFSSNYVNHQLSAAAAPRPDVTPKDASVAFFAARLKGLPDLKVTIEASVVSRDMAAASFVYEGTQTGVYFGVAPTGRRLRFTSCDIFRVADGMIVEHWGMGDIAGVMTQLKA
ncbi:ester cyclase [Komagataeibacter diospyri]|uniref:ester cyclase n=1 Tax=Komagataeibacter diospyri TaxID=1932662 RepID=UPI0037576F39